MSHTKFFFTYPGDGEGAVNIRSVGASTRGKGLSLVKRRRWYGADDATEDDDDSLDEDIDDDGGDDDADDDTGNPQNVEDLPEWAQKLLGKTRNEAAENRRKLREKEETEAKRERERKEKQGEFEQLYKEAQEEIERLKAYQVQVETLSEAQAAHNTSRIDGLPKAAKKKINSLVEKTGIVDPYKLRDLLDELIPTVTDSKAPDMNGGDRGDGKGRKEEYIGSDKHLESVANRYRLKK